MTATVPPAHPETTPTGAAAGTNPASSVPDPTAPAGAGIITLSATGEARAVPSATTGSMLAMASLRAGIMSAGQDTRTPIDMVAVIDVSGSMAGGKLALVKKALEFVVTKGLQPDDTLAVVAFATQASVALPPTAMDAKGKAAALAATAALHTRDQTNLSGGLLLGLDVLAKHVRTGSTAEPRTRCAVLLTDGHANQGITRTADIVTAVHSAQVAFGAHPATVHCMGFGTDHNEDMLREVAQVTAAGQYYFVEQPESVPTAFADALGGLVSVVAQNAELHFRAVGAGASIARLHGGSVYQHELAADGSSLTIALGDLIAEDEKDILVDVNLAALPAPAGPGPAILCAVRYFNVATMAYETAEASLDVARPEMVDAADAVCPPVLSEHKDRISAADALFKAREAADKGDLVEGTKLLEMARLQIQSSPSSHTPSAQALQNDLTEGIQNLATREVYFTKGRKAVSMAGTSHWVQRSSMQQGAAYTKSSKARMLRSVNEFMTGSPGPNGNQEPKTS